MGRRWLAAAPRGSSRQARGVLSHPPDRCVFPGPAVTNRSELLSLLFQLAAFLLYTAADPRRRSLAATASVLSATGLLAVCATLCKESGVMILPILAGWELFQSGAAGTLAAPILRWDPPAQAAKAPKKPQAQHRGQGSTNELPGELGRGPCPAGHRGADLASHSCVHTGSTGALGGPVFRALTLLAVAAAVFTLRLRFQGGRPTWYANTCVRTCCVAVVPQRIVSTPPFSCFAETFVRCAHLTRSHYRALNRQKPCRQRRFGAHKGVDVFVPGMVSFPAAAVAQRVLPGLAQVGVNSAPTPTTCIPVASLWLIDGLPSLHQRVFLGDQPDGCTTCTDGHHPDWYVPGRSHGATLGGQGQHGGSNTARHGVGLACRPLSSGVQPLFLRWVRRGREVSAGSDPRGSLGALDSEVNTAVMHRRPLPLCGAHSMLTYMWLGGCVLQGSLHPFPWLLPGCRLGAGVWPGGGARVLG